MAISRDFGYTVTASGGWYRYFATFSQGIGNFDEIVVHARTLDGIHRKAQRKVARLASGRATYRNAGPGHYTVTVTPWEPS